MYSSPKCTGHMCQQDEVLSKVMSMAYFILPDLTRCRSGLENDDDEHTPEVLSFTTFRLSLSEPEESCVG